MYGSSARGSSHLQHPLSTILLNYYGHSKSRKSVVDQYGLTILDIAIVWLDQNQCDSCRGHRIYLWSIVQCTCLAVDLVSSRCDLCHILAVSYDAGSSSSAMIGILSKVVIVY